MARGSVTAESVCRDQRPPPHLMERRHPRHVDPVQVDLDTCPPQHVHDRVAVALLDVILEHHLVRESHSSLARV